MPQTRLIGPGALSELGGLVARLNPRRVMLVTGTGSYLHSGACALVEPALAGMEIVRLGSVSANPQVEDIERALALWRTTNPCLIVAVGGGSVIDLAKLTALLGPGAAHWTDFLDRRGDLEASPMPVSVAIIAVPTTAGSGAEATRFATFYQSCEKRSISHPLLRPGYAIVDPLLTASVPAGIAASTALDALSQAIESLWAVCATPESQALAEAAVYEILPCLGQLVDAPTAALRERMARGAHLAGRAIDLSRTTAAHALSYALTADLGVPHGHAVALVLPAVFRINAEPGARGIQDPRGSAHLAAAIDRILRLLDCRTAEHAAAFLGRQVAALGLAIRLPLEPRAVSAASLAASLAAKVNGERLRNNPVALSPDDLLEIYEKLLEEPVSGRGGRRSSRKSVAAA